METSCNARFMQPLLPNFRHSFSIPVAFMEHLEKELKGHPLMNVVLMTKDEPNRQWLVKINGGRNLKDGWNKFCDEHDLKVGNFVVFSYKLNLVFQVTVFDHLTSCQRHYFGSSRRKQTSVLEFNSSNGSPKKRRKKTRVPGKLPDDGRCLVCQITLTSFAFKNYHVYLSKYFIRSCDLSNKSCNMKLIDGEDRTWEVKLMHGKCNGQSYIRSGWKRFQAANKLRPQDVICFKLLKSGKNPVMKCYRKLSTRKK